MSTGPAGTARTAPIGGATGLFGSDVIDATAKPSDVRTGQQALPRYLPPNFAGMPAELKQLRNWVL